MFKFLKIYQALEINKSTQDVADDLKYSNLKGLIFHKAFYFVGITLGIVVLSVTWDKIAHSHFRQALIKNGTSPFLTLLKSDYTSENEDVNKAIENYKKQIAELDAKITEKGVNTNTLYSFSNSINENKPFGKVYPYEQFIKEYKENTASIDLKGAIYKSPSFLLLLNNLIIGWLVQHEDTAVELNGNSFTISLIAQKLDTIEDKERRKEMAKQPLDLIMPLIGIEDTEATRDLVVSALGGLKTLHNSPRFKALDVSNLGTAWQNVLKYNNGYGQNYDSILREIYEKNYSELSKKANEEFEVLKKQRNELAEAKNALLNKVNLGQQAQRAIQALQADVKNYDKNKEAVEKALDVFKKDAK